MILFSLIQPEKRYLLKQIHIFLHLGEKNIPYPVLLSRRIYADLIKQIIHIFRTKMELQMIPHLTFYLDPEIILCHSARCLFYDHKGVIKRQIQIL